jgi:DNA-directed RNA polymerase subunit B
VLCIENSHALVKSFLDERGWSKFQVNSYNKFIEEGLQNIVTNIGHIKPEVPEIGDLTINFGKVKIGDPSIREADGTIRKIFPAEARIRSLTYSAPVYIEMIPLINGVEQEPVAVHTGNVPMMVGSRYCSLNGMSKNEIEEAGEDPDDPGGYFIVNGTERTLVLIEEIAPNRLIVSKQNKGNFTESIRINSQREGYVQRHLIERKNDGSIYISFANIRRLPIVVLLKSLGFESDKDIIEGLEDDKVASNFYSNLFECEVSNSKEAMENIGNHIKIMQKQYRRDRINQIIDRYLVPHLGQEKKNRKDKAKYLLYAIRKIIELSLGKIKEDDIDHSKNKRLKLSGELLELLFRSILVGRWGLITRIKYNYQKMAKRGKLPPIQTIVESNVVSNQLISAMATGAWVGGRKGVSQRLERTNFVKTISHLRMVLSPLTSTQEHFEARELHPTNWGRYCPAETPEGPTIGLRKHLSLMAEVTKGILNDDKEKFVKWLKLRNEPEKDDCWVFVDGAPLGYAKPSIMEEIVRRRRAGLIPKDVNLSFYPDLNEMKINTDEGRVRRPLVVVENRIPKLNENILEKLNSGEMIWDDLTEQGIVEFLDAEEEDNALIAIDVNNICDETKYIEIAPLVILGVSATLLPFAQHNRGDRVNFGAKMVGQSLGLYQSNFMMRTDTKSNVLAYPQMPLVRTRNYPLAGIPEHPAGQNVVIALMTHHGYNMDDAIIFNKASIERGLFRSFFYRFYQGEEKRYWGGQEDIITIPNKDVRGYRSEDDYAHLNEDGILSPETVVNGGDVLLGKVSPMRFLSVSELMGGVANMRDTSLYLRSSEKGTVDRIIASESTNGTKIIKICVRDQRIPELGDKFASRHGQKSVVGRIVEEESMPFTASGYIPDLVMNPHAIPSRQTIGQLLEVLSGKAGAMKGEFVDATPFEAPKEKNIRNLLRDMGFRSDGKETMYNGETGDMYQVEIFVGLSYYQKLDHMVSNKIQSRARGPVTLLTRQPTEGKAKEGGLRLGEMEKDCLIAHGAVLTLKERFDSDRVEVPICSDCGVIGVWNKKKNGYICPACNVGEIKKVAMSYAFKLLLDELKAMMIYPKLRLVE